MRVNMRIRLPRYTIVILKAPKREILWMRHSDTSILRSQVTHLLAFCTNIGQVDCKNGSQVRTAIELRDLDTYMLERGSDVSEFR